MFRIMGENRIRTDKHGNQINNVILSALPEREFRLLKPHLRHIAFSVGQNLQEPGNAIDASYFINSGLVSLVVGTKSGKSVEVGIAGYEGMTGVTLTAGIRRTTHWAVTEVGGDGFRVQAGALEEALETAPGLQKLANRFAAIQAIQLAQTAACNRLHNVRQRMARWLLMTDDRVKQKTLSVTHDFLSMMLGTDRPTVTAAAKSLQHRGVIEYSRGKLKILNRKKLERAVCECYGALQQFNKELGLIDQNPIGTKRRSVSTR
jgi:CRP-like cAMP-binding protein